MGQSRMRKVNEQVRELASEAIAEVIGKEAFITVTAVDTASDLKTAVIWVSILGDEKAGLEQLNANKSEIQHNITGKMYAKNTPRIEFKIDHSKELVSRIEELLNEDDRKSE
jgi:ribosome-binding factor A